jgi:methyl-accepting chemotaxis protein
MKSIRNRLVWSIVPILSLALILLVVWLSWFSYGTIKTNSLAKASMAGQEISESIRQDLEQKARVAQSIAATLTALREAKLVDRSFVMGWLEKLHTQHPDLYTTWAVFDHNGWDGRDSRFANQDGWDDTGSFGVYTAKKGSGFTAIQDDHYFESEYFLRPKEAGKLLLMEPYEDTVDGVKTLNTSIALPLYDQNKNFIGSCGVDTSLQALVDRVGAFRLGPSGAAFLLSASGKIISFGDKGAYGKNYGDVIPKFESDFVTQAINSPKSLTQILQNPGKGAYYLISYPIVLSQGAGRWTCVVYAPLGELLSVATNLRNIAIIGSIIVLLITLLTIFFVTDRTIKPLLFLRSLVEPVGDGDFTVRFTGLGDNEIGQLGFRLDALLENLSTLISRVKAAAAALASIDSMLQTQTERSSAETDSIARSLADMRQALFSQVAMVSQVTSFVEQNMQTVASLDQNIEGQAAGLEESSAAVEEMTANVVSITRNMERVTESVAQLQTASNTGKDRLRSAGELVRDIASRSENLLEVNTTISGIAARTNLLAMNAAIEAAHAGSAGRGFAVVADEIRNLAESSAAKSKESALSLKSVRSAIESIVSGIEGVEVSFQDIVVKVETVENLAAAVRNALEEQAQGSKQVLEALSELNRITTEVRDGSKVMRERNSSILDQARNLSKQSEDLKGMMETMDNHGGQIHASVQEIAQIAQRNEEELRVLIRETAVFKIRNLG